MILNVLRGREKRLLSRIDGAHEALDRLPIADKIANDISPERLTKLKQLVGDASSALEGVIALRSVDFADFKEAFSLDQMLSASVGAGASGGARSIPGQEISSARADGEIQLIGRPLLTKS